MNLAIAETDNIKEKGKKNHKGVLMKGKAYTEGLLCMGQQEVQS